MGSFSFDVWQPRFLAGARDIFHTIRKMITHAVLPPYWIAAPIYEHS